MIFFFQVILSFLSFFSFSTFQVFNLKLSKDIIQLLFHFSSRHPRRCLSPLSRFIKRHYIFETYNSSVKIDVTDVTKFSTMYQPIRSSVLLANKTCLFTFNTPPRQVGNARKSLIVHNNAPCNLNIWLRDALYHSNHIIISTRVMTNLFLS